MSQRAKFIDLSRTFLPIDPNSLPETMHGTAGEDNPEQRMPVVPYEGWNFMPSSNGYKSYFGLTGMLGIDALATPAKCRDIFTYQREDLSNLLVALCDDGIWTKQGESPGAWTHVTVMVDPGASVLKEWSRCIIENVLYIYRQGEANVQTYSAPGYVWTNNVPTTLNMAGQLGIFKAGSRLGFWDSANSIGWSGTVDRFNVTPDISTQANITKIIALVGKIINVLQHGDGFVIYGTKSIVGVQKNLDNTFLWNASQITTAAGIAYRQQACLGAPDTTHYAWTSNSLHRVENFKGEVIVPELYDYLKESQTPIYLKMLEGRYLFLQVVDADYIDGRVTFYTQTIPGIQLSLVEAAAAYSDMSDPETTETLTQVEQDALYSLINNYPSEFAPCTIADHSGPGYVVGVDYGLYEDHIQIPVTGLDVAELVNNKLLSTPFSLGTVSHNGQVSKLYSPTMPISVVKIDGATVVDYAWADETSPDAIVQNNQRDFFDKCRLLWDSYNVAAVNYIERVKSNLNVFASDAASPALAGEKSFEIGIAHGVEYEMGQIGCTYYCIAYPRKLTVLVVGAASDVGHPGTYTSVVSVVESGPFAYCGPYPLISYSHPTSFFRYDLSGNAYASPNSPPAYSRDAVLNSGLCVLGRDDRAKPTLLGMGSSGGISSFKYGSTSLVINGVSYNTSAIAAETFTYPPASFLMQAGAPAPYDIEWLGAYVYDTHYKRWGKMKAPHRQLLDFSPINSTALGVIPYTHFGVNGALLNSAGVIKVFDAKPLDSYLKWGKIGNFRFGMTTLEEVRSDHRRNVTGQLEIETSLDGLSVESSLTKTYDYTNARQVSQGIDNVGRWHNLAFRGQFDLTYLEFRAWLSSRR